MTLTGHNTTTWITPPWVRGLPGVDCPNGCTQRIRDAREADAVPWCGECTPPGFAVVCWKPGEERTLLLSRKDWVRRGEASPAMLGSYESTPWGPRFFGSDGEPISHEQALKLSSKPCSTCRGAVDPKCPCEACVANRYAALGPPTCVRFPLSGSRQ